MSEFDGTEVLTVTYTKEANDKIQAYINDLDKYKEAYEVLRETIDNNINLISAIHDPVIVKLGEVYDTSKEAVGKADEILKDTKE